MLATAAHGDELTRRTVEELTTSKGGGRTITYNLTSSDKRKKARKGVEEPLPSGSYATCGVRVCCSSASERDVSAFLTEESVSKMARSAVALHLTKGTISVYSCSGVVVQRNKSFTRVLTSANLVATLKQKREAGCGVTIQVRDVLNNADQGWLEQCDFDHGIAFVKVALVLDVCVVPLRKGMETLPYSDLVAVQLTDSWASMPVRGVLTKDSGSSEDGKMFCEFSKPGDGVPLFDGDGNFVGMNLSSGKCSYVGTSVIIEHLEQFEKRRKLREQMRLERSSRRYIVNPRVPRRINGKHYNTNPDAIELTGQDLSEEGLNCLGYPKRPETDVDGSMVLVNTFEESFGDSYDSGNGIWNILSKTVAEGLSQSVVSLASFIGKMRFFACSGIIIKWSGCTTILTSASLVRNPLDEKKIIEDLRIEVLLPSKLRTEGRLEHYNLHYNVALVSFKGFGDLPPANIHDTWNHRSRKVVAVGRCFESSILMATSGRLTGWPSRFDCDGLQYSTCEVTKAGIGGPVVDADEGKFVGMSFYDWKEGSPLLPQALILRVLAHFEKKGIVDEVDVHGNTHRWPVPKPLWRHPEHRPSVE